MPNFEYIALDAKGQETTGTIAAANEADAYTQLRRNGLYPTKVGVQGKGAVATGAKKKAAKARRSAPNPPAG